MKKAFEKMIVDASNPLDGPCSHIRLGDTTLMQFRYGYNRTSERLDVRVEDVDFQPAIMEFDKEKAALLHAAFNCTLSDMINNARALGTPQPMLDVTPLLAASFDADLQGLTQGCGEHPRADGGPDKRTFYRYLVH